MSASEYFVAFKTLERRTVTAAGTINKQCCVGYDSLQVTTTAAHPWGIAEYSGVLGEQVTIFTEGSGVAKAGAAITKGQPLATTTAGTLAPATTGQYIFARALGAASGDGKFLEVHITREGEL